MASTTSLPEATIEAIVQLATALRDSQVGLTDVSSKVRDKVVVKLLQQIAAERAEMVDELNGVIQSQGLDPPDSTSWLAELRNVWTQVRAAVCSDDVHVVLTAFERYEAKIVGQYRDMLGQIPASPIDTLLREQYQQVKNGHALIRELLEARNRQTHDSRHASSDRSRRLWPS